MTIDRQSLVGWSMVTPPIAEAIDCRSSLAASNGHTICENNPQIQIKLKERSNCQLNWILVLKGVVVIESSSAASVGK